MDIGRRARLHAALGEPVRLAIVDHLGGGDASPGELSAAFEVLDDPAGLDLDAVRSVRDEIERRVRTLLDGLRVPVRRRTRGGC